MAPNISLICPNCGSDHCVGNPRESDNMHTGTFYCFTCKTEGTWETIYRWESNDPSAPGPVSDGGSDAPEGEPAQADAG